MNRRVIALAGEAQVGKDSFAEFFKERGWFHGSFAANLKEMCQDIFNLTLPMVETQLGKQRRLSVPRRLTSNNFTQIKRWMARTHSLEGLVPTINEIEQEYITRPLRETGKPKEFFTPREILQFVGTDICRRIIDTYHIDVLVNKIENTAQNVIITDARFPNERSAMRNNFNAYVIRIKRPGYSVIDEAAHPSETSLEDDSTYDLVILNDGTLQDLREKSIAVFDKKSI